MRQAFRVLVCLMAVLCTASAMGKQVLAEIEQLSFLAQESTTPPAATLPGWQPRSLPDDWDNSRPDLGGNGWYRAEFGLDNPPQNAWGVYLPRLRMNAAVYVNETFIGDGGAFEEPIARNWNRPLYFTVPTDLLRAGSNVLHIRLRGDPNLHAGLFGLEVGPDQELRPVYEQRFFLKITLNQAMLVGTLLMAALMGLLWLRRPQETVYGWFALTSLLWAANSTHFFVRDLPFDTWTWEWFAQTTTDWFAVLLAILIHRYYGLRRPWLERVFLGYAVAGTLWLSTVELERMFAVANVLHGGAVIIIAYAVALAFWRAWRERRTDGIVLALGFGAQAALGLHDWLLQLGLWGHENWYLLHYGSPLFLAVMAWLLASRFVRALNESEALNTRLEQRVAEEKDKLESSYREMHTLQRAQVVAEERERIMRDLHDGLGGQLVSALAIAQQGGADMTSVQQTLRDALDDLRLVIDSLDPAEGDLLVLLGTVRGRLEPRLAQQGLRFEWQVRDLPQIPGFTPEKALQVLRIIQEAIANVLKHAHARTVTVRTGTETGSGALPGIFIEVMDDGVGLQAAAPSGRGLANMRNRAARIGARLDVTPRERGTSVRLWLPLPAAA